MTEGNSRSEAAAALRGSWRASELIRRPVVDVRLGQHIGEVSDVVFDPTSRQIAGLLVQGRGRDSAVLQAARRTFGGTAGLTYLNVGRTIALHADMVTVQADKESDGRSRPSDPVPRLGAFLDYAVISIQGRRLGRFADLLLGPDGHTIVAYLIRPPEGAAAHDAGSDGLDLAVRQVSQPALPGGGSETPVTPPQDAFASPAPALLVIQADEDVRFGRDLIVVAGRHDAARVGSPSGDIAEAPTWQRWESDAPTEQVHH